jgi:hypothetical protein
MVLAEPGNEEAVIAAKRGNPAIAAGASFLALGLSFGVVRWI